MDAIWTKLTDKADSVRERPILSLFEGDAGGLTAFQPRLRPTAGLFQNQHRCGDHPAARTAEAAGLPAHRAAMFEGEKINNTEDRAVLHTALRPSADRAPKVDGQPSPPECATALTAWRHLPRACARAASRLPTASPSPTWSTSASRVRPRPGHGQPRAFTLSGRSGRTCSTSTAPICRYTGRAGSGADAGHHCLQDLHHHRDPDQRGHRNRWLKQALGAISASILRPCPRPKR